MVTKLPGNCPEWPLSLPRMPPRGLSSSNTSRKPTSSKGSLNHTSPSGFEWFCEFPHPTPIFPIAGR
eukprot:3720670-Pyramimonas_sp.AAC.1